MSNSAALNWYYVSMYETEVLWGAQVTMGIHRRSNIGFDLKYSYIPSSGGGIKNIGGLSLILNIII